MLCRVRCTIISGLDGEGTVRTQLVDSGLILRAPLSSLVPLQTFSPALNAFPHQVSEKILSSMPLSNEGLRCQFYDERCSLLILLRQSFLNRTARTFSCNLNLACK